MVMHGTQLCHSAAQCIDCQLDSRLVWVKAWTNVLCVLGIFAFGVVTVLTHSWSRPPPQTHVNPFCNSHI